MKSGYADGFVIPVLKKNLKAYFQMAKKASKVWKDHGAIDYKECAGDDLNVQCGLPFTKGIKLKKGETVVFSWITYKSRKHRDQVNAKVMKDPRLASICPAQSGKEMPFDMKRMMYAGFKVVVSA